MTDHNSGPIRLVIDVDVDEGLDMSSVVAMAASVWISGGRIRRGHIADRDSGGTRVLRSSLLWIPVARDCGQSESAGAAVVL